MTNQLWEWGTLSLKAELVWRPEYYVKRAPVMLHRANPICCLELRPMLPAVMPLVLVLVRYYKNV